MTCSFCVDALSLGDVTTSGKGAKTAPFTCNGGPADFTLPALQIAFEPSAYQSEDATRVNLVLKVGLVHETDLATIDEWILKTVAADPVKFFGKAKSCENLAETYTPCLKKTEVGQPAENEAEPAGLRRGRAPLGGGQAAPRPARRLGWVLRGVAGALQAHLLHGSAVGAGD